MPSLREKHCINFARLVLDLEEVMLAIEISLRSGVSKSAISNIKARNSTPTYPNGAALRELYVMTFQIEPPSFPL